MARRRAAARSSPTGVAGHPDQHPAHLGVAVDARRPAGARRQVDRTEHVRALGQVRRRRAAPPPPSADAVDRGHVDRGRQADLGSRGELGFGVRRPDPSGSAPARSGSPTRRPPRPPRRRRGAAPGPRRPSSGAARPRTRAGPVARAAPTRRGAAPRRSRRRAAGSAPGVATRPATVRRAPRRPRVAAGGDHGGAGKRPAELLGGAPRTDDDGAHRVGTAAHAAQCRLGAAAPPAHRARGVAVGQRHRPGAVPAPGDGAALPAGQRRDVAAPRHLHQHGMSGLQRRARRVERHRRQPRGVRGGVAFLGEAAVVERDHPRRARPHHRPGGHQIVRPAGCATSACASAVRAYPPIIAAHRSWCARSIATSRACGYGARGSARRVVAVVPHHHQTRGRRPARTPRCGCR